MFNLILNGTILLALLLFTVSLESGPPSGTLSRGYPDCTSIVARYLIAALVVFPGTTIARLRSAERVLQRVGAKFASYAGLFTGRPYISEILISAFISIVLLGSSPARRWIRRLVRRATKFTASNVSTEPTN